MSLLVLSAFHVEQRLDDPVLDQLTQIDSVLLSLQDEVPGLFHLAKLQQCFHEEEKRCFVL